ncbi:Putative ripening-related protein 2 [Linum perenne]
MSTNMVKNAFRSTTQPVHSCRFEFLSIVTTDNCNLNSALTIDSNYVSVHLLDFPIVPEREVCSIFLTQLQCAVEAQKCKPSGYITGKTPPPGQCNQGEESDCCKKGKHYTTFTCSPAVTSHTKATLTWNSFEKGGSGGAPSECDNQYHSDDKPVVALSTGWFNKKSRCLNFINIHGNGKTVKAMVVDECDSKMGCDSDHDYQPPCPNNIVDASKAVWKALGVPEDNWGDLDISWSDA